MTDQTPELYRTVAGQRVSLTSFEIDASWAAARTEAWAEWLSIATPIYRAAYDACIGDDDDKHCAAHDAIWRWGGELALRDALVFDLIDAIGILMVGAAL